MIVHLAGEVIRLLPQRAAYWQARRTLLVADIHFGKAASFRAHGILVPHGTTAENLAALDGLLAVHDIDEIVFLGDFLHAKAAHAARTLAVIRQWRAAHSVLRLTLIRGNHDGRAGDPPSDLDIQIVDEPHRVAPFALCHHPQHVDGHYVLAGHLHPVYRLGAGRDVLRLPCFVLGTHIGILPAFGAFTGGMEVRRREDQRIFVASEKAVTEVPWNGTHSEQDRAAVNAQPSANPIRP